MQIAKAYTRSTGRQEPLCGSLPAGFLYSPQQMEGAGTMTVTLSLQMWKLRRSGAGQSSKVTRGARGRVRTHTRPSSGARAPGWRTPLPVPNVLPFTPRATSLRAATPQKQKWPSGGGGQGAHRNQSSRTRMGTFDP